MENYELNLLLICRVCLEQQTQMYNLLDNTEESQNMHEMLSQIADYSIDKTGETPFYLCKLCEVKLKSSFTFREQCKKSYKCIENYLLTNVIKGDPIVDESLIGCKRVLRKKLLQFPSEKVSEAIEANKRNFYENIECIECGFIGSNVRALSTHMTLLHKHLKENWCSLCNQIVEDLTEHSKGHKDDVLKCQLCGKVFRNKGHLAEHLRSHTDLRPFECETCKKSFSNKRILKIHERIHTNERPYKCFHCIKSYTQYSSLKLHLKHHSDDSEYLCHLCNAKIVNKCDFEAHKCAAFGAENRPQKPQIASDLVLLEPPINYVYPNAGDSLDATNYSQNLNYLDSINEQNVNNFEDSISQQNVNFFEDSQKTCNDINKSVNINDLETTKAKEISIYARNFCTICNRKVRSLPSHNKEIHKAQNVDENGAKDAILDHKLCTVCGKQFKTGSKLKIHMRIHTGEAPYKCRYCEKRLTTRHHLLIHERTHTGEKPHICHICGKGFAQSSVLNTHMRLHTGRPEKCTICEQRFCRPAELRLHMRKHTGEKPFMCDDCGQTFVQRSHLMEHIKTHSDERPYKCKFCEKGFKQSSSLKSHVQIHLGYKPYRCSQCPYSCRQNYSLTQHMKQHADDSPRLDRPHHCGLCGRSFTTLAMLQSHASSSHANSSFVF